MKVLFAVSNDNTTKAVVSKYQETYKEIITSKNVYYFNAIIKELQRDKAYDAIVIGEDLEPISNNNYEQIDKFLTEKLDSISDEASKPTGEDIPIIFICSDRRNKSDQILRRFFSMSIYNAILGNDRSVSMVCSLINKPRNKKEAKKYYQIADTEDAGYQKESNDLVSEEQIQNILSYYKKIGLNEKKCVQAFDSITNQYDDTQLRIIVKFLPISVKAILEANSAKYQQLMTGGTVLSNGQYNKFTPGQKGPNQLEFLEKDLEKPKLTEPVVIPSTMNIANSQVITNRPTNPVMPAQNPLQQPTPVQAPTPTSAPAPNPAPTQAPMPTPGPVQTPNPVPTSAPSPVNNNNTPSVDPFEQIASSIPAPNPMEPITPNTSTPDAVEKVAPNPIEPVIPNPMENVNSISSDNSNTESAFSALDLDKVDEDNQNDTESEEKRGRGRPRKNPVEENTGIKRKRGRPRKLTPEDEVGNPIASLVTSQAPSQNISPEVQTQNQEPAIPTMAGIPETQKTEPINNETSPLDPFGDITNNNQMQIQDPLGNTPDISIDPFGNTANSTQNTAESNAMNNTPSNPFANPNTTNLMPNQNQNPNMGYTGAMAKKGKVAAFVGTTKNGTSFVVNNLAMLLSQNGIKTAVVDLSSNKNAYYMYTNNDPKLMKTASESLNNLQNAVIQGVNLNNALSVYTSLPDDVGLTLDPNLVITNASANYDVVLLDCDFKTSEDYFTLANEIYLVQSMDAFTIQPLTKFLSDLKMKNKLDENKLRVVVNKNIKLRKLDYKMIVGGMSKYNEPSMTLQRDLFNPQTVKTVIIPFEEANYAKYIESIAMCQLNLAGYTKALIQGLEELKNVVYPLVAGNTRGGQGSYFGGPMPSNPNPPMYGNYQAQNVKPKRGLFGSRKQGNMAPMQPTMQPPIQQPMQSPMTGIPNNQNNPNNQFSNNVNDTLNKMRNF